MGIAREVAPGSDPRGVVRQIRQMNDLGTTPVVPGQSIVVPSSGDTEAGASSPCGSHHHARRLSGRSAVESGGGG